MTRKSKPMLNIGGLSAKTREMPHYIPTGATFSTPDRHCNSMQPNLTQAEASRLAMLAPPARPGSMQAFSLRSHGTRC